MQTIANEFTVPLRRDSSPSGALQFLQPPHFRVPMEDDLLDQIASRFGRSSLVIEHSSMYKKMEGSAYHYDDELDDFDEDGEEDVIIGVFLVGANQMRYVRGLGNGKFAAPVTFDAGSRPLAIAAYDFNLDGHLDLAVASNFTHVVSIVMGNGISWIL